MAFKETSDIKPFRDHLYLSSPSMHGPEATYMMEAYETNWMSTVGKNINEIEAQLAEFLGVKYAVALSSGTAALHLATKLAGEKIYGQPSFYRFDGTHIFDKHKIKDIVREGNRVKIVMTDKTITLEVLE